MRASWNWEGWTQGDHSNIGPRWVYTCNEWTWLFDYRYRRMLRWVSPYIYRWWASHRETSWRTNNPCNIRKPTWDPSQCWEYCHSKWQDSKAWTCSAQLLIPSGGRTEQHAQILHLDPATSLYFWNKIGPCSSEAHFWSKFTQLHKAHDALNTNSGWPKMTYKNNVQYITRFKHLVTEPWKSWQTLANKTQKCTKNDQPRNFYPFAVGNHM